MQCKDSQILIVTTHLHTMLKVKKKEKEGRCAQTFAVESEMVRRGGRHDLAVYPQCLSQNFDAMARSQTEKFPKTCSAWCSMTVVSLAPEDLCPLPQLTISKSAGRCGGMNMPNRTSVLAITGFPPLQDQTSHLSSLKRLSSHLHWPTVQQIFTFWWDSQVIL